MRFARRRGAALVEAVVMMPTLLALLLGARWLLARHAAEVHVIRHARSCAWAIAASGCRRVPPECSGAAVRPASRSAGAGRLPAGHDALSRGILQIPLVKDVFSAVLPDVVDARRARTIATGPNLEGSLLFAVGIASLPCNELPNDRSLFEDVVRLAAPSVF